MENLIYTLESLIYTLEQLIDNSNSSSVLGFFKTIIIIIITLMINSIPTFFQKKKKQRIEALLIYRDIQHGIETIKGSIKSEDISYDVLYNISEHMDILVSLNDTLRFERNKLSFSEVESILNYYTNINVAEKLRSEIQEYRETKSETKYGNLNSYISFLQKVYEKDKYSIMNSGVFHKALKKLERISGIYKEGTYDPIEFISIKEIKENKLRELTQTYNDICDNLIKNKDLFFKHLNQYKKSEAEERIEKTYEDIAWIDRETNDASFEDDLDYIISLIKSRSSYYNEIQALNKEIEND